MTTENTYNGWTNWETWTVNMYLDGAIEAEELSGDAYADGEMLRAFVEECFIADTPEGLANEFVTSGMQAVNWQEIAEGMIDAFEIEVDNSEE